MTNTYLVEDITNVLKTEKTIYKKILELYQGITFNMGDGLDATDADMLDPLNDIILLDSLAIRKHIDIMVLLDLCFAYYLLKTHDQEEAYKIPVYKLPNNVFQYEMVTKQHKEIDELFITIIRNKLIRSLYSSPTTIKYRFDSKDKELSMYIMPIVKDLMNQLIKL